MGKASQRLRGWLGLKNGQPRSSDLDQYPEKFDTNAASSMSAIERAQHGALPLPPAIHCGPTSAWPRYSSPVQLPQARKDIISKAISLTRYITPSARSASGLAFVSSGLNRIARAVAAVPAADAEVFVNNLTMAMSNIFDTVPGEPNLPNNITFQPRDITGLSSFRPNFLDALWALPNGPCRAIFKRDFGPIMYEIGILVLAQLYFFRNIYIPTFMDAVTTVAEGVAGAPPKSRGDVAAAYSRWVDDFARSRISTEALQQPIGSAWTADDSLSGF